MPILDHVPFGVRDVDAIREAFARLGFTTVASVCRWSRRDRTGEARTGEARTGEARTGEARTGEARTGEARTGEARTGEARTGEARTGKARTYEARALSIVFEHAYLDLIEVEPGDPGWDDHLRSSAVYGKGIAPSGIVFSSRALGETRASLAARGVGVGEPYEIVRELRDARPPEIRYRIFSLRGQPRGQPALPFAFLEDSAPEAMRTDAWLQHPNSATGIRCVHLRVPSLQAVRSPLRTIAGGLAEVDPAEPADPAEIEPADPVEIEPADPADPVEIDPVDPADPVEVDLGPAALLLHETPRAPHLDEVSSLLPRRDRAALLAIEVAVADMEVARALLARNRIPTSLVAAGLAVAPAAGYGCGFVFVPKEGGEPRQRSIP